MESQTNISENEAKRKSKTNSSVVKESFINICSNTTAHALPNIFRTDVLLVRIFWFLILLGGIGASIYYTYISIYSFFQYPVSVNINRYDKSLEDFPAVTICNTNPFESSNPTVMEYLKKTLRKNGLDLDINPTEKAPAIYQVKQAAKVLKAAALADKKTGIMTNETSFSLDSMLISCYFDGEKCNSSDFYKFYTFEYGNCFTFNSYKTNIKTTSKYGQGNGLTMELFTGFPGRQDYYMERRGLYLIVHNNTYDPIVKYEGIRVPVGYSTDIGIRRTFYDRLSYPFSQCRDDSSPNSKDSEYFNKTTNVTKYSNKLCTEVCLQNMYIIPKCNCSDPEILLTDQNQVLCKTLNETICVENVRKNFDSSDVSTVCGEYCPIECERIEYDTDIFFSDYPTEYYYNIVSKQPNLIEKFSSFGNVSYERFKKSVLMVNVYYHSLSYTMIEESQAITYEDVLGVIGGQVGLFLGASFLTFFEPIEFVIEAIYKLRERKRNAVQEFK